MIAQISTNIQLWLQNTHNLKFRLFKLSDSQMNRIINSLHSKHESRFIH